MHRPSRLSTSLSVLATTFAILLSAACGGGGGGSGSGSSGASGDTDPGALAGASEPVDCEPAPEEFFEVFLPKLGKPPDEEKQEWDRPEVWEHLPGAYDDAILIPNGRPIYALIVAGYQNNAYLDEMLVYDFAQYLMSKGAYVHYAWWNNLLAPYMERPLHHSQSHPGSLTADSLGSFTDVKQAGAKAMPGEDYQFVADAELLLAAIREHNPNAMIIVVGHSMGGASVVHLADRANVLLDILAPIDPVGNRNYPWSGPLAGGGFIAKDYNWTRWRVSRDTFLGYKAQDFIGGECVPYGPWLKDVSEAHSSILCQLTYVYHDAPTLRFGMHVINLFHRYQTEALFPFDFAAHEHFEHTKPSGGSTSQTAVVTKAVGSDPGGWPLLALPKFACCATGDGVAWATDGHGEIVGYRGAPLPVPLAVRVRTSPECGSCPNPVWPARMLTDDDEWIDPAASERKALLQALELLPFGADWPHEPTNTQLCMVSDDLIELFIVMNKPPTADAGEDQTVECTGMDGTEVTLDGSGSADPDEADVLTHSWSWPGGFAVGSQPTVSIPLGTHCIELTVRDPSGHIDKDILTVTVEDTTPPDLTVTLSPDLLWPPNHKMVDVLAMVEAEDLCSEVADVTLVSITSSDEDDGKGDGHTTDDIQGEETGTLDTEFQLRAEFSGIVGERVYTVTYQATDEAGNRAEVSAVVVVKNPSP